MKIQKPGMRNIKTGIGVMICVLIGYIHIIDNIFFAATACIVCMQTTVKSSLTVGLNRLKGTLVGGLIGFLFVLIRPGSPVLACLGVITTIYVCNVLNIKNSITELKNKLDLNLIIPSKIKKILDKLNEHSVLLEEIDAFCGRAGGLTSLKEGVYRINEKILEHARKGYSLKHYSNIGVQIAYELAKKNNKPAFTVNPVTVDELQDTSRITGIKGLYRQSIFHALNQKEVAYQYAKSINKKYNELNLIVVHLGSGITVGVHKKGKVVDVNNALNGDGPFTTNRAGSIDATNIIDLCFSGKYTKDDLYNLITKRGGLVSLLETNDIREVIKMIQNGNKYAQLVLNAMIYQIAKQIGAMSINFKGNIDAIIITGAIANSKYFVLHLREYIDFLGKVIVMPGDMEMEALVNNTLQVMKGKKIILNYTGESMDYELPNF